MYSYEVKIKKEKGYTIRHFTNKFCLDKSDIAEIFCVQESSVVKFARTSM